MEWTTVQHLDLRHVGRSSKPFQPHAATFHPTQALVAVAAGTYVIEFDAYTGSKISSINIGAPVVRMSYSPTSGHAVVAILEDCTIRSCDFDTEQTWVLHSPEKKMERITIDTEVYMALTPLQPVVFFGFHRRMSVTVVGTVEGGRAPTKIKTDLKKPIVNLACHPRLAVLYVGYADGLIRAYNIHTYAVLYTLQFDNTIKLIGAGAFAFHPTLEWIFVGDRRGTLLAWDVSTERPIMIGITQVGSQPIISVAWLPILRILATLSKDGTLQVWKTRVVVNSNRPQVQSNFFEPAAIEQIDIPRILSQQGGETVYPLPRIRSLEVHPKLNLAALTFANMMGSENARNKAAYTREGRKQLFAVLQSARGSSASALKEKLQALGSSGILAEHQLQAQLQEHHMKGPSQLTISDIARKAFLFSHFMEGHAKSAPISRLPLITILDTKNYLKDIPVCQPIHLELNFFSKENRVLHYPTRAFYIEGVNLMAYNLSTGAETVYKKLFASMPGHVEFHGKYMLHSRKQHLFLIVYEFNGASSEVVLYWENTSSQSSNSKANTIKGRDAAFIGLNDGQFAILDEDKIELSVYTLPGGSSKPAAEKNMIDDQKQYEDLDVSSIKGPLQFTFESEVDRIFSTPVESTLMFACFGDKIGMAKLVHGYSISTSDGPNMSTKGEGKKSIKLKTNEIVLQVHWQETLRGCVAGILTTHRVLIVSADLDILASSSMKFDKGLPSSVHHQESGVSLGAASLFLRGRGKGGCVAGISTTHRVLIVSADLDILASSSMKFDKGLPSFRSLLWVGPALMFSTTTAISVLGWDGKVRTILSSSMPNAVLVGTLNDRLLLANPTDINPRQKKGMEIKHCLVGLLEPLLIGYGTMQQNFEQKLDLSEILYQITSRFDSLRITPRSLDILATGVPVCGDLAVSLSQSGPQFTQVLRGSYAIKARRFSTALSVLKDEFLRSRDYPQCPPTSHLFHRFRQLGYACIKYGQFDSAKETFEVISDYESLLDLFICHLNPSAMRRLAQRLEEENADSELRRYCERILRVRSTGWTQGIFANFAAESMVPKGPEWGGGNWEIRTPSTTKSIPQWELAAEVMPYMRTDDGSIPSLSTDHIGVYLGLIKGRGNIVEVSDNSLVKAFKSEGTNSKSTGSQSQSSVTAASTSNDPPAVNGGDSLMNLESLTKVSLTSSAADEQAKAEEEFKKSIYGNAGDGSSSDEEGVSKAKKLRIRIKDKPAANATVDVDKIKEATKQFKLGDAPIHRNKSLTNQFQELSLNTNTTVDKPAVTTTTTTTNTPVDPFGTSSFTQTGPVFPAGPMPTGAAVGPRPIPEDFFQNTIPSLQVAASLPPPGTYLSRYDQNPQRVETSKVPPNQMTPSVPNVSVTPIPQVPMQPVSTESFGLPDGGVPPQSVSQPAGITPHPHLQSVNIPVSTQPLDLSSLEGPGSVTAAKPSEPPPPTSVRPGQVPRGAAASVCFKTGLVHLEQNQLPDALSCFDEAFLALAKDNSRGADIKAQATICAQYKIAVTLLQEIGRLQKVQGPSAISAKDEMARLSRHLGSLPLQAKHRINCIRTAIKRNMDVQNYGYAKQMLELLLSKAPPGKQDELRSLIDICVQRGLTNKSIDPFEDPSQFCAATLSRLSTIGYDVCDLCGAKFSALASPGCIICGMGSIKRSDALTGPAPVPSPFG